MNFCANDCSTMLVQSRVWQIEEGVRRNMKNLGLLTKKTFCFLYDKTELANLLHHPDSPNERNVLKHSVMIINIVMFFLF